MPSIIDPKDWFGLKKESYLIDPIEEADDFIAHNKEFASSIVEKFSRSLITGRGPKLVLIHLHGDGKTHVAKHACAQLQEYSRTIFIVCPVMSRASKYMNLHYDIMMELNRENILFEAIEATWSDVIKKANTSEERLSLMKEAVEDPELATAIWAYKEGKADYSDLISWLSSSKVPARSLTKLQLVAPLGSLRATNVLISIARLYRKYKKKVLILFIDNADNLTDARAGSRDFKEAFRLLADAPDLGMILTINVLPAPGEKTDLMAHVPSPLKALDVMSRIGPRNYEINPPHMREEDVDTLVLSVNRKRANPERRPNVLEKARREYGDEISEELYPFTKRGYDAFKTRILAWLMKSGDKAKLLPRDVLKYIDDCIGQAVLMKKIAIDEDVVAAVGEFVGALLG